MSDEPMPKRIRIDTDELNSLSRDGLIEKLQEQESYVRFLEKTRTRSADEVDDEDGRGSEEKLKQLNMEAARRENTLVLRLTNKEQELQDCLNQISEMKQAQTQSTAQLRSMLLDPALNLVFQRMSKEVDESKEKLKQTQNELSAWKFTPDSQTGMKLMAKCRMLLQENEELGKMIASGRTAKLEGEIALQKTLVQEMKKNQEELDDFVGELEEDVEGMQSMIYVLQTQLKDTKEQLAKVQAENDQLRSSSNSQHHLSDSSPVSNGGKHVNHSASPKPETPQTTNNVQSSPTIKQEPMETEVKTRSPEEKDFNNACPASSHEDIEAMETDTSAAVNCSGSLGDVKEEPHCDSVEWTSPAQDRTTTQANSHGVNSHILTADSTSCQDNTDAMSSDAWSPQIKTEEDNGAEDSLYLTDKPTVVGDSNAPLLSSTELKLVRNGVEQVTQLESEEDV